MMGNENRQHSQLHRNRQCLERHRHFRVPPVAAQSLQQSLAEQEYVLERHSLIAALPAFIQMRSARKIIGAERMGSFRASNGDCSQVSLKKDLRRFSSGLLVRSGLEFICMQGSSIPEGWKHRELRCWSSWGRYCFEFLAWRSVDGWVEGESG